MTVDEDAHVPRAEPGQPYLPLLGPPARDIAERLGLDWWAVLKLHDDGLLSFNPEETPISHTGMEAEFTFLGSLVAAGCDPRMLKRLLTGLERPYRYDINHIYYDWPTKQWRKMPEVSSPEESFQDWLSELVAEGDVETIREILDSAQEALDQFESDEE